VVSGAIHQPGGSPWKLTSMVNSPDSAGQPPADAQQPPFDEDGLPERVLGAAGMRPAVEDPGHVPGDAGLEMLDPLGLQAPGGRRIVEGDPGRDVFYGAAASEAPAMRGRTVFIAGGGNSAGQAALHLAKWARQVTILVRARSLAASMSDYLIRQIGATPNIDVRYRVQVADGTGTGHLESLVLQDTASGTRRTVPADALFVLIGAQPRTHWLREAVARDRQGFILTGPDLPGSAVARWPADPRPLPLETSLPGGIRRRRRAPRIGQTGRLRGRRRRGHHPPGPPLPGTSRRGPQNPRRPAHPPRIPASTRPGLSRRPGDLAYAHRAQHDRHPHRIGARKFRPGRCGVSYS
jgi:hypothetical protein